MSKITDVSYEYYEGTVYNFHCEDDETYFANGLLVHNCYKGNTAQGDNMSLETFKKVFHKLNENNSLTQIAFGTDATLEANPEIWDIFDYCNSHDVRANVTVADVRDLDVAEKLKSRCGAVSVSLHGDWEIFTQTAYNLTTQFEGGVPGLEQCNIHQVIMEENFDETLELFHKVKTDPRLSKVRAIVLLALKNVGRAANKYTPLSEDRFHELLQIAFDLQLNIGTDSCGGPKFMRSVDRMFAEGITDINGLTREDIDQLVTPCESTLSSQFVDVHGILWPCSFATNRPGIEGVDITQLKSYVTQYWNNAEAGGCFRARLLKKRECPEFVV